MARRSTKRIVKPTASQMGTLVFYQPLPANGIEQIDPFLLIHHHGPQVFPPRNGGLPFGPHPHKGFETVTFIYQGDVEHRDSNGFSSVIRSGGVQWMTAGKGLVHSEKSSPEFKEHGGPIELIQLWVNLPAKHKLTAPDYSGLQAEQIAVYTSPTKDSTLFIVSGEWNSVQGPVQSITDVQLATLVMQPNAQFTLAIPAARNILFYVLNGNVSVNGQAVEGRTLLVLGNDGEEINLQSSTETRILVGHAYPIDEPVVAHGPFVMNTTQEIQQAIYEYQTGKMGMLEE